MRRDVYEWVDPWSLLEECEYAIRREEEDHREAMGRMAEAHAIAFMRVQAYHDNLNRTAQEIVTAHTASQPMMFGLARTTGK